MSRADSLALMLLAIVAMVALRLVIGARRERQRIAARRRRQAQQERIWSERTGQFTGSDF